MYRTVISLNFFTHVRCFEMKLTDKKLQFKEKYAKETCNTASNESEIVIRILYSK